MKSLLFKIPKTGTESLLVQLDEAENFYDTRHYHSELQISLIQKGSGTRFIGDSVERFQEDDIFVIGPNLPHVFRNENVNNDQECKRNTRSISIYFNTDIFGAEFFNLPEFQGISGFIKSSSRGIEVGGETKKLLSEVILKMVNENGVKRILGLLSILDILSTSNNLHFISSMGFSNPQKESDNHNINNVFEYLMENYGNKIRLDDVAALANMTSTAFCRYFKSRTKNTFSEFLIKVRIGQASRFLIENDLSISEIAYQCGFNNLSNFNRQFKKINGITPSEYLATQRKNA